MVETVDQSQDIRQADQSDLFGKRGSIAAGTKQSVTFRLQRKELHQCKT